MTPTLHACARHLDGTCPHKDEGCPYRKPHEHGTHTGQVILWCAVPAGKSEKIDCVAVKSCPPTAFPASRRPDQAQTLQPDRGRQ